MSSHDAISFDPSASPSHHHHRAKERYDSTMTACFCLPLVLPEVQIIRLRLLSSSHEDGWSWFLWVPTRFYWVFLKMRNRKPQKINQKREIVNGKNEAKFLVFFLCVGIADSTLHTHHSSVLTCSSYVLHQHLNTGDPVQASCYYSICQQQFRSSKYCTKSLFSLRHYPKK